MNYYHRINIFLQKNLLEKICKQPDKYQHEVISKLELIKLFILKNLSHMHLTICGNIDFIKKDWQFIEQFITESQMKSRINMENIDVKAINDKRIPTLSPATIIGSPQEDSG